ncbi:GNAT family N-acetyltransferase [Candidatus Allofournierella excrementavium]|uniref:GNAT family N-acetyltransferase n=1 Tax=Candidatus Allofournierella excrementavium TaxID=2838591 RepID=UPI003AB5A785
MGFLLNESPSLLGVTEFLWGGGSLAAHHDRRSTDTFYSEICTMRNRGLAEIWTLEESGVTAATAGAYAVTGNAALLSAVETAPAFRGKGCAGALVCALARRFCEQGKAVCLVARPGVEGFYEKLGFEQRGLTYGHAAPEND